MTIKIGVFESLCGRYGLGRSGDVPEHFLREGRAMLAAVCRSLAASSVVVPTPLVHESLASELCFQSAIVKLCGANDEEILAKIINTISSHCLDGLIIIAPEIGGELRQLISTLQTKTKLWNCSGEFLDLACDKWKLANFCVQRGIPHPRTALLADLISQPGWQQFRGKVVIKPRDGAGCADIRIFECGADARSFAHSNRLLSDADRWIVQAWISGLHSSRSLVSDGSIFRAMPIVSQEIRIERSTEDDRATVPHYQGAALLQDVDESLGRDILRLFHSEFQGQCQGWVGFDLVISDRPPLGRKCFLVEINPRFTTSFVHLQQMQDSSLLAESIARFMRSK
jgi:predicted ATP-grasp superfamily ATP-dependent carboligase